MDCVCIQQQKEGNATDWPSPQQKGETQSLELTSFQCAGMLELQLNAQLELLRTAMAR